MLPRTRAPVIAFAVAGLVLIALVGASLWLAGVGEGPAGGPLAQRAVQGATIGGPFSLVNQRGERITEKTFLGKPTLYFFGFTHCPEVCPTSLMDISAWLAALGADASHLNVVFVTVDPERDTPDVLGAYLESFDPRIVAATGTSAEIADMAKIFRVYYRKVEQGESYTMDHTAAVYLMDAKGQFSTIIAYREDQASALAKVKKLL